MRRGRLSQDNGFSLIELLIVIVVLGVLGGIVVFGVGQFRGDSAQAADLANLKQLNTASTAYRATGTGQDLSAMASDTARMAALFDRGLLTDDGSGSRVVTAQVQGATFTWDPITQAWIYSAGAAPDIYDFTASGASLSAFRTFGTWTKGATGFSSTTGQLFAPNDRAEYSVSTTAQLTPFSTYGGHAILLASALDASNRDTGYAIQFDRGFGSGSIVVRTRVPSTTSTTAINEGVVSGFVFNAANTGGAIPDKATTAGKAWWEASHTVSARVIQVSGTSRRVEYSVDGNVVFNNFTFTAPADPSTAFAGLRAWGDRATFGGLTVS